MARAYVRRSAEPIRRLRHSVQLAFLLLNVWIGVQFYVWVRYYETGGATIFVTRPAGVEGWLPIAALMSLKHFAATARVPDVHPAGMFLLVAFIAISVLFRKGFCSWLCPIGTLSEWLWRGGRDLLGRNFVLPRWADVPLRSLKYVLLALFAFAVASMSTDEIVAFLTGPYGIVADVKMLSLFRDAGSTTIQVCSVLIILSVVTKNFWCRYLCPYGALMGLAALFSPTRITRDPILCIDCGKCTAACPSLIPVDRLLTVRTAECTGCLTCVSVCPVKDALDMRTLRRRRRLPPATIAAGIVLVFALVVGYAKASGHWNSATSEAVLFDLVPRANSFSHP